MTKIANKAKCNIIESGNMNNGSFLGDLLVCPTYEEIINTDKFNVSGTYENNQLVKESDITKYTGKTKNYCTAWGEWDLTNYSGTTSVNYAEVWLKFHISFLFPPGVNLNVRFNYTVYYWPNGLPESTGNGLISSISTTTGYTTLSYSSNTQDYAISSNVFKQFYGNITTGNPVFIKVEIDSVTITPTLMAPKYNFIVDIKPVEQNYHKSLAANASLEIISYQDDTVNKIEKCQAKLTVNFSTPTGTTLTNNYNVGLMLTDSELTNFHSAQSVATSKASKLITHTFNAIDDYGLRGYKLPYFKTKFYASGMHNLYFYGQWNPRVTNTGIELTNLITEE